MNYINQLLQLPYAHFWVPGVIFLIVVGGLYGLLRRPAPVVSTAPATTVESGSVELVTTGPMQPRPKEQRYSKRREGNALEVHLADPEDKSHPQLACVHDRSIGGLRLSSYYEIEVGSVLSVRPVSVSSIVPWVDVEIRSCRPSEELPGEFDVGCQFVKSPPYSILMLFG